MSFRLLTSFVYLYQIFLHSRNFFEKNHCGFLSIATAKAQRPRNIKARVKKVSSKTYMAQAIIMFDLQKLINQKQYSAIKKLIQVAQVAIKPKRKPNPPTSEYNKKLFILSSSRFFSKLFSSSTNLKDRIWFCQFRSYFLKISSLSSNFCFLCIISSIVQSYLEYYSFKSIFKHSPFLTNTNGLSNSERGFIDMGFRLNFGSLMEKLAPFFGEVISSSYISSLSLLKRALSIIRHQKLTLALVSSRSWSLTYRQSQLFLRYFQSQRGQCPKKSYLLSFLRLLKTRATSGAYGILILSSQKLAIPFFKLG